MEAATPTTGTATLIRSELNNTSTRRETACLYSLNPSLAGVDYATAFTTSHNGHTDVDVYPADDKGRVLEWTPLVALRGNHSNAYAFSLIGYTAGEGQ